MVDVAKVNMFGIPVGTFRWDDRYDVVRFEYDQDFVGRGLEPSPLMMPVRTGRVYSFPNLDRGTFQGLPGMLADSLPDTYGRALFDKWLALTGQTSSNPIETLCFLGKRCMGALEFEPAMDAPYDTRTKFEIDTLVDVARDALDEKSSFGVNLNDNTKTYTVSSDLYTIPNEDKQNSQFALKISKLPLKYYDTNKIKLDGVSAKAGFKETENYGRLEYSFFKLAKACGIEMTECSLIEENGRAHFLTKRFDRQEGRKIHMQTLCGIAHYDYRLHRAYSYEQAFNVMRSLRLSFPEALELFRRMVFNVVVRNQDDHTKNISFLMGEDGKWRLSPAYDMGYAYNPNGGWTATHQMSMNGKFDDITRDDLLAVAALNNIKDAAHIIDEVCDAASQWPKIASECDVPTAMIEAITPNLLLGNN